MPNSSSWTFARVDAARIAFIALAYLLVSELASMFPAHRELAGLAGLPYGVLLGALLLRPRREWRTILGAILLTGIAVNLQAGRTLPASASLTIGDVAEALTCAWLITHFCGPNVQFARTKEILWLTVSAIVVNGSVVFLRAHVAAFTGGAANPSLWPAWWAADGLGTLLVAPLVVAWIRPQARLPGRRWKRVIEWGCLLAVWCGTAWYASEPTGSARMPIPGTYVLVAMLAWPALRFGQRGVTLVLALLVAIACASGAAASGPLLLGSASPLNSLLGVQVYVALAAVTGLLLAASHTEAMSAERLSHEHESRLRRMLDQTDAGYFRIGLDGRFQEVNRGWLKMHGFTQEQEVVGRYFSITQVPEDQADAAEFVEGLRHGERIPTGEFSRLCRDGSVGYHTFSVGPVMENGRVICFEGFLIDTTERRRMEAAIEQHEAQLQAIFEAMQDAVLVLDLQGAVAMANASWASLIEVTEVEAGRQNLEAIADLLDLSELDGTPILRGQGPVSRALRGETFQSWRVALVRKGTSKKRVVSMSGGPVCNRKGTQTLAVVVVRDISEHVSAEEAARRAESEYRAIFDGAIEGMYRTAIQGTYLIANPAFAKMLGYDSAQEVISAITDSANQIWLNPDEHSRFTKLFDDNEVVRGYQCQFKRKDGTAIWASISSRRVCGTDGQALYYEGFIEDITERKQRDEDMQRMNAELRQLSAELLRSQDVERRRIALELHDSTAQLLAGLGMNLTALQKSRLPRERAQKLLADSASLCAQCSNEIRTLSYVLHPPMLDELGLGPALDHYAAGFTARTGIPVKIVSSPQLDRLGTDAEIALFRIAQESLANVHRHAGASEVKIQIQRHDLTVRMEIADNGIGLPPELFGGPSAGGARLGVGLLGMRERVSQLGGTVTLESEGGARIVVSLPIRGPA